MSVPVWHLLTGEYPPKGGGIADYTAILARALADVGRQVHVWTPARVGPSQEHRIAVHMAHRYLRKPRHRRETELVESRAQSPEPLTDATVESREIAAQLYAHLDKLDATKRIALVLFAIEELSIAEIAVLMGASETATKSRLFWARRTLRKSMGKDPAFAKRGGGA